MNSRFKELMHRFRGGILTHTEHSELMDMVRSGDYDREIGADWIRLLESELDAETGVNDEWAAKIVEMRKNIYADSRMRSGSIKPARNSRIFVWSSAAAVVLLLVIALFWGQDKPIPSTGNDIAKEVLESNHFSGKQFLHLPDGSTVILNEDSELSYNNDFGSETREVRLIGEAFFDVAHDPAHPFIVKTGAVNTRVLGTAFNVTAWPDEEVVLVTVERGKVSVGDDKKVYEELLPNEQITVDTETREFEKMVLDEEQEIEWKRTFFVLDQVSMENAMEQIGERYDVDVEIVNPALRSCIVNGAFLDNESLEHVLTVLSLAMNAEYRLEGNQVEILGGIGCSE